MRARRHLGWTYTGSAYCQLIRTVNREKRYEWALGYLDDPFTEWTDETTVQLETHKRRCCRKLGEAAFLKPRPKHPLKVHVWAGISWNGRTKMCIFQGIMTAEVYVNILEKTLLPSRFSIGFSSGLSGGVRHQLILLLLKNSLYPSGPHRFIQDNDPKHLKMNK